MLIKNTQSYTIEKTDTPDVYIVRRILYGTPVPLSSSVKINLPDTAFAKKYKNYDAYCITINRLIDKELHRITADNFHKSWRLSNDLD